MNIFEQIFADDVVVNNVTFMVTGFAIAFMVAFLVTPWVGRLAQYLGAIDVAPSKLSGREDNFKSRMNEGTKPRMGGIAVAIGIVIAALVLSSRVDVPAGIWYGFIIVVGVGMLDDIYGLSGKLQLVGQFAAALAVIAAGVTIPNTIQLFGNDVSLAVSNALIEFGSIAYEFIFPGHVITLFWIVGIINVVNWVGGVDGLNISVSSIIGTTLLVFALSQSAIPLSILIAIFLGGNLGLLPYNYNPSKIIPGTTSEFINGYLLAVFALLGPSGWTATLIIFALPIIDAVIVIALRIRSNPEVLKSPLKILSINDTNHLHHRLMGAGYSRKAVLFIEVTIVSIVCVIALLFGIDTGDGDVSDQLIVAFSVAITFLFGCFTLIYVLMQRNQKQEQMRAISSNPDLKKEAVVKVMIEGEDESEEYERFYY